MQRTRKTLAAFSLATTAALTVACNTDVEEAKDKEQPTLELASSEVLADADGSGIDVSHRLFESSDDVVVTDEAPDSLKRGEALAEKVGAPMLTLTKGAKPQAVVDEISRLGAENVATVGAVDLPGIDESGASVEKAPDDDSETGNLDHDDPARTIPNVVTAPETSRASVATARAAGAEVTELPVADPRATKEGTEAVAKDPSIAVGEGFGDAKRYQSMIDLADNGELPGGGSLVFPGRRMVALYGHPSGPDLGALGEQPPAEAAQRVKEMAKEYEPFEKDQPIVPAFEIIATVASADPGDDGDYANEATPEELIPYIDAITDAGGYAVLDLQPGRASLLDQAKLYEDLLKRPNVGLALDPEWKIGPDELPMTNVGHVEAAEVNEVSDWLAGFVRDNNLPQKALVLHQFQVQMLRDREQIKTDHPELSMVIHADGHGTPDLKFETWDAVRTDTEGKYFMAWKNFYDEDNPTFTPEQTYAVDPRPWFVSYQ